MITTSLIAAAIMAAQYGNIPPPSGSSEGGNNQGFDAAPYVQLERKCFDKALSETQAATQDLRQKRFNDCLALRDAMIKHATAQLDSRESRGAKRELDRALRAVENSYAKRMGVVMPNDSR